MSALAEAIRAEIARVGRTDLDPAHVEAWVCVAHPTRRTFSRTALIGAVGLAVECVDTHSKAENEAMREAVEDREQRRAALRRGRR